MLITSVCAGTLPSLRSMENVQCKREALPVEWKGEGWRNRERDKDEASRIVGTERERERKREGDALDR